VLHFRSWLLLELFKSFYAFGVNVPSDSLPPSCYLLTVPQTAQRLQLGINRVYELVKAEYNPIPTVIIGRTIRIPVAGLERWLEEQTRG